MTSAAAIPGQGAVLGPSRGSEPRNRRAKAAREESWGPEPQAAWPQSLLGGWPDQTEKTIRNKLDIL